MQTTIKTSFVVNGIGLHTGRPVRMRVDPAPADHGIVFLRTDLPMGRGVMPARWDRVEQSPLNTRLTNPEGATLSTVEHVMAALAGLGIGNVVISLDGPELPVLDGSAAPFVRRLMASGVTALSGATRLIRIRKPIEVGRGDATARLEPADGFHLDFHIDFPDPAIGRQSLSLNMRNGAFVRALCDSRTFCMQSEVDAMHAVGLALGGTYDNAVVFDAGRVVTPGGLRHPDEPVRHKMLDALGDLAQAGMPIMGRYIGVKAGHAMTNQLLRALFARPDAFEYVIADQVMESNLPGAGVKEADLALCA